MQLPVAKPVPGLGGSFFTLVPLQQPPVLELLHPEEKAIWDALAAESRKREWWAGRIAARAALLAIGVENAALVRDERGRPRLVGAGTEDALVSVSHGRRWSAALAAKRTADVAGVGVDLVEPEDIVRLRKLASRFLGEGELDGVVDPELGLAAAWAAREAVAKATATGMWAFAMSRVHLDGFQSEGPHLEVDVPGARLAKLRLEDGTLLVGALADRALVDAARAIAST